jgi:hypothetical protein
VALKRRLSSREFVVQDNNLTGTVPTELGELSTLSRSTVEENQLSGTVPSQVCALVESNVLEFLAADCGKANGIECDCCHQCNTDEK